MKITRAAQRFGAGLVAIAALIALNGVADAATSKPAGMSKAEYQALAVRSEALNEHYRLGKWKVVPAGMTASEYQALMIRSEALNKKYGLGTIAPVAIQAGNSGTTSFDWLAALIVGLTVGGLALATGGLLVLRHHGPTPAR